MSNRSQNDRCVRLREQKTLNNPGLNGLNYGNGISQNISGHPLL